MMLTPLFFVQYALELEGRDWKLKEENAKDEVKEGLKTSYTVSNGGHQQFGGWSNPGRKRFEELTKLIKEVRKTEASEAAEQFVLDTLRAKYKSAEKESSNPKKVAAEVEEDEEVFKIEVDSDEEDAFSCMSSEEED